MYLKQLKASTDPEVRSLLQKAVRRGASHVVEAAANYLSAVGDKTWLRSRVVVITFEEAWHLAGALDVTTETANRITSLQRAAAATKHKDAAGLGALAFAFSEGDSSMLDMVPSRRDLRAVSEALSRPTSFFKWARAESSPGAQAVVDVAEKYLAAATWGWDKATIIAGAWLATNYGLPVFESSPHADEPQFPYWVALDKHTPVGKDVLRTVAQRTRIPYRQLIWSSFYFESAKTNSLAFSPWFETERTWRLNRANLTVEAAGTLWARVRPEVEQSLRTEAERLHAKVANSPGLPTDLFHSAG